MEGRMRSRTSSPLRPLEPGPGFEVGLYARLRWPFSSRYEKATDSQSKAVRSGSHGSIIRLFQSVLWNLRIWVAEKWRSPGWLGTLSRRAKVYKPLELAINQRLVSLVNLLLWNIQASFSFFQRHHDRSFWSRCCRKGNDDTDEGVRGDVQLSPVVRIQEAQTLKREPRL